MDTYSFYQKQQEPPFVSFAPNNQNQPLGCSMETYNPIVPGQAQNNPAYNPQAYGQSPNIQNQNQMNQFEQVQNMGMYDQYQVQNMQNQQVQMQNMPVNYGQQNPQMAGPAFQNQMNPNMPQMAQNNPAYGQQNMGNNFNQVPNQNMGMQNNQAQMQNGNNFQQNPMQQQQQPNNFAQMQSLGQNYFNAGGMVQQNQQQAMLAKIQQNFQNGQITQNEMLMLMKQFEGMTFNQNNGAMQNESPPKKQRTIVLSCCDKKTNLDAYAKTINRFYKGEDRLFQIEGKPVIPECPFCDNPATIEDLKMIFPEDEDEIELHFKKYSKYQQEVKQMKNDLLLWKEWKNKKEEMKNQSPPREEEYHPRRPAQQHEEPRAYSNSNQNEAKPRRENPSMQGNNITFSCCKSQFDRVVAQCQIQSDFGEKLYNYKKAPRCPNEKCGKIISDADLMNLFPELVETIHNNYERYRS